MKKIYISAIIAALLVIGGLVIGSNKGKQEAVATAANDLRLEKISSITHGHGLMVDIADPNKVYIATHRGIAVLVNDKDLYQLPGPKDDYMGFSVHPTDPNIFFSSGHGARGGNVGFQKSEDRGASWSKLSDGVDGPVDFHAMTISPVNPDLMFGWFRNMLQRSVDGGNNWNAVRANLPNVISLTADTKDENTVYASTVQGIFMSKDKGDTWSPLSGSLGNGVVTAIAVHPGDNSILLSFSRQLGLAMSNDRGVTWKKAEVDMGNEAVLYVAYAKNDPESVYMLTDKNSLYKSVDGGYTWRKITL